MTVLEALAILEAAILECKSARWIRQSYGRRSIFWSRTFNRHGSFHSFATTSTASENTSMLRGKVNSKYFALRFPDQKFSPSANRKADGCTGEEVCHDSRHPGEG